MNTKSSLIARLSLALLFAANPLSTNAADTYLVKDMMLNGEASSNPSRGVASGGWAYFLASDYGNRDELWRTDGSAANTEILLSLPIANRRLGTPITLAGKVMVPFQGRDNDAGFYVYGAGRSQLQHEYLLQHTFSAENDTPYFSVLGNEIVLSVRGDASIGYELWATDGSPSGARLIKDIATGAASSSPRQFHAVGSQVYFIASNEFGNQLWVTDGTTEGTRLVKKLTDASELSEPIILGNVGPRLVLIAYSKKVPEFGSYPQLWTSDGTSAGTNLLLEGSVGSYLSHRRSAQTESTLFFAADLFNGSPENPSYHRVVMATDGTKAGTRPLVDTNRDTADYLTVMDGKLFFISSAIDSNQLWVSDGTSGNTKPLSTSNGSVNAGRPLGVFSNKLYFSGPAGQSGDSFDEIWVTDGTSQGTARISDINPGMGSARSSPIVADESFLLFAADDGSHGTEPWIIRGTSGPSLLKNLRIQTAAWQNRSRRTVNTCCSLQPRILVPSACG